MTQRHLWQVFAWLCIPLWLAGCSHNPSLPATAFADAAPGPNPKLARLLAEEGITRLRDGKIDEASRIFNAGLKFEPDSPDLHLLNGLTYHLSALKGESKARSLAEAGYQMTLAVDPGNFLAAMQLAQLYLEMRNYQKASEAFAHALKINADAAEAQLGLAVAAYYARDLSAAAEAVDLVYAKLPLRADAARAAAIIFAANGDQQRADAALLRFDTLESNMSVKESLRQRVGQWKIWRVANVTTASTTGTESASTDTPPTPNAETTLDTKPTPQVTTGDPSAASSTSPGEPIQRRWTDCDTAPANPQSLGTTGSAGSSSNQGDETTYLPPLPSPCKNLGLPRMAVFDVVLIRTEDTSIASHGINLLDGLNLFFSRTKTTQLTGNTSSVTQTTIRGLAANPETAILYSLNIANSGDSRSEVLARPTLVALDRQPSAFFSGRILTLGIAGQAGGSSTLSDRPIGISLSLTPTFVSNDSMLVSVRVARSFFELVNENVNFTTSFQSSRNMVTANVLLNFGQTLILSGLTEHEIQRGSSGVPVLKDIPALQYLFSNHTEQNFTSSVIVMLTPRKPVTDSTDAARAIAESGNKTYALNDMAGDFLDINKRATTTLDSALWHSQSNSMYFQFRNGDLKTQDWNESSRLDKLLKEIRQLLYF
jgi:hypothetical protein